MRSTLKTVGNLKLLRTHWTSSFPYLFYTLLSIAVLGYLLSRGYILSLDMIFSPNLSYSNNLYGLKEDLWQVAGAPYFILVQQINHYIPMWLLQKFMLFTIFFLSGLGAYKLSPVQGTGAYFAGTLYMVNPFTYARFLAGHWGVLWSYALIPFAIKSFIDLVNQPNFKNITKVTFFSTLVGLVQVHGFFLLLLSFSIILTTQLLINQNSFVKNIQAYKSISISAILFLALNLYWLLPVLTAKGNVVNQLNQSDMLFFAPTTSSSFGIAFDIVSMHGFWRGEYTYIHDIISFSWLFFVPILFLAIFGFFSKFADAKYRLIVVSFGSIGILSCLLAIGAASEFTRPSFEWLWDHVSFFRGFRDSHKFVALLCLSYALLGGLGIHSIVNAHKHTFHKMARVGITATLILALVMPLIYAFPIFGAHGDLKVTDYPNEWYEVNDRLNTDNADFNALFLPWHQYMDFEWLPNKDKRLGNPSQYFFDNPVIAGDNLEIEGIYSQSINPISKYVELLLDRGSELDNFGELLAPLNVKYIILVHEVDYEEYDFLYKQDDLAVDLSLPGITLFTNQYPTSKAYAVDSSIYINDLDEYLQLSQTQDVMEHLYIMGNGQNSLDELETEQIESTENCPVKYKVNGTEKYYTVFTVPQNVNTEHWEYNGQEPVARNLGFMPAFESDPDGGEVVYTRFYNVYLPSYIVSAITLLLMIYFYFRKPKDILNLSHTSKRLFKRIFAR